MNKKDLTRIANLLYFDAVQQRNNSRALAELTDWERQQIKHLLEKIRSMQLNLHEVKEEIEYLISDESGEYYTQAFVKYHELRNKITVKQLF